MNRKFTFTKKKMIKYAGIALLSVSIFVFGFFKSYELSNILDLRKSVLLFLYTMEREVLYGGKQKKAIISRYSDGILDKNGFTQYLAEGSVSYAVNTCLSPLDDKDKKELIIFFSDFGKSDSRKKEAEECKRFLTEFEKNGVEFEKKLRSKIYLFKRLGIIFALATAVILI